MLNNSFFRKINKKYHVVKTYDGGGSSAGALLVEDRITQKKYVLKYATWNGIGSSGTPWLIAQATRLNELSKIQEGKFANCFPTVVEEFVFENSYYYVMDYFPNSHPLATYYYQFTKDITKEFMHEISSVIDTLVALYSVNNLELQDDYILTAHIKRMKNRTALLSNPSGETYNHSLRDKPVTFQSRTFIDLTQLFSELIKQSHIYINDKKYANFNQLLPLISSQSVVNIVTPNFLPKYYHGDSTLRNYLRTETGDIKLIDVRGTHLPNGVTSTIDIAYELAKISRTFFLEIIRNNHFTIRLDTSKAGIHFGFSFHENNQVENFIKARNMFLNALLEYQKKHSVLQSEDNLDLKILYAEAAHFIADAVNRIESDRTGMQTIAYYLIGLQLYNEFLQKCKQ